DRCVGRLPDLPGAVGPVVVLPQLPHQRRQHLVASGTGRGLAVLDLVVAAPTQATHGAFHPRASARFCASSARRPEAACWYLIAAWLVECPPSAMSSARVAPCRAASVSAPCRRSWNRRSSRPAR